MAEPITITLGKYPNPKQIEFFKSRARHTAYGGARGGGKSWAVRTKCIMLAGRFAGLKILLLRRTLAELTENHVRPLQQLLNGVANFNSTQRTFTFPNGSVIRLGYCDAEKDVYQYQGHEYDVICLEEATHFTESQMQFLTTCNRSVRTDFTPRMYYTCNPGGVGHAWVKRLFIDRQYRGTERAEDYKFIQATLFDNKVLMDADPEYIHHLENLPDHLRRAHLYGDWDVLAGQYFSEFSRDIHVVKPFEIPEYWQRYRAIDYGLDCAACVWAAFDELGNAYIYREYAEPNKVVSDAAREICERTEEPIEVTFAPADMWGRSRESGATQAELFANGGLPLVEVRQSREAGWLNLAEWFKVINDGTGKRARLRIFSTCNELVRCITQLVHDEKKPNDCATEPHEITHLPDALRYLMAGRPQCAELPRIKDEDEWTEQDDIDAFVGYGM